MVKLLPAVPTYVLAGLLFRPQRSREPSRDWRLARASVMWRGLQGYRQHRAAELNPHWHRPSIPALMRGHSRSSSHQSARSAPYCAQRLNPEPGIFAEPFATASRLVSAAVPFRDISCRRSGTSTQLRHSQVGFTDEIHRDMSERGDRSAVSIRSNCRRAAEVNGQGRGLVKTGIR